jgi:hypothetical protein
VADLSWLRGRGYAEVAANTLVGDRFQLTKRQRAAVVRSAATDDQVSTRRARRRESAAGCDVVIDGFNVLITVERGLAGGAVLKGRDTAMRDLASVHGTYRTVAETQAALAAITTALAGTTEAHWLLDAPVSNSGRLATALRAHASAEGLPWRVDVVPSPDQVLAADDRMVATSDAWILDQCGSWLPLAELALAAHDPWIVDLSRPSSPP